MTDHLTGIANRAQFDRTLRSETAHALRTHETFSILYMDLDGFKQVNDRFGHAAGDEVLRKVARRLTQQLRTEDEVARCGGDEFGVIARDSTHESAQELAKRIAREISSPIMLTSGDIAKVGVSTGVATFKQGIDSGPALLDQADRALYQAKREKGIL